jgi:hypothetical protein
VHHKDWALNYLMTMNGYRLEQVAALTLLALLGTKGAQILTQLMKGHPKVHKY